MIFSAHLVAVKCEVFTTSSTTEIQLCARPATQLTHSPYFRQIAYTSPLRMREYLSERGLYEFWDNHQSSLEHEWSKSHSPNHPCVTSVCVCRVAQGVKNNLFSQGSLWNFRTGLTTGLGLTVFGCWSVLRIKLCFEFHLCLGNFVGHSGVLQVSETCYSSCQVCKVSCLCVPSSFGVYKPWNLSLCLRTDSSLSVSVLTPLPLSLSLYSILLLLLFFFSVAD